MMYVYVCTCKIFVEMLNKAAFPHLKMCVPPTCKYVPVGMCAGLFFFFFHSCVVFKIFFFFQLCTGSVSVTKF